MVILVDTSVWVSYLRRDGSRSHAWLQRQIGNPDSIATTEPIVMELLAGASRSSVQRLESVLSLVHTVSVRPDLDFRDAGLLASTVRAGGLTVRSILDCLIAAVALRHRVPIAHRDTDYAVLAHVSPLAVTDLR